MASRAVTLTITGDDAERLARLLDAGRFVSAEEAVGEALSQLEQAADPALESWLTETVGPRYDADVAGAGNRLSVQKARQRLFDVD